MFDLFRLWFGTILRIFRTQRSLVLENLVLRQQLVVLKRKHPKPRLDPLDKLFWLVARRFLASMERGTRYRPTRDRCSVAPSRIQTLLDYTLQSAKTRWWKENLQAYP